MYSGMQKMFSNSAIDKARPLSCANWMQMRNNDARALRHIMESEWTHQLKESTNLVQQLTVLGVCVPRRKSLFVRRYDYINLSEALNKIREENNQMAIQINDN